MRTAEHSTADLERLLADLRSGNESSASKLVEYAVPHFRRLIYKIRGPDDRLRRWTETDDILQQSAMRLLKALKKKAPSDALAFQRLVALQIRRELIDLARHHFGPLGSAANHQSQGGGRGPGEIRAEALVAAPSSCAPDKLDEWCEFHEQVASLPEKLREVVDLVHYNGLTQQAVADALGLSKAAVKLRWLKALKELRRRVKGEQAT